MKIPREQFLEFQEYWNVYEHRVFFLRKNPSINEPEGLTIRQRIELKVNVCVARNRRGRIKNSPRVATDRVYFHASRAQDKSGYFRTGRSCYVHVTFAYVKYSFVSIYFVATPEGDRLFPLILNSCAKSVIDSQILCSIFNATRKREKEKKRSS